MRQTRDAARYRCRVGRAGDPGGAEPVEAWARFCGGFMGPEQVGRIAVGELSQKLERGGPVLVGDVRAPVVFGREHIPGSACLFLREVDGWAPTLPQDREVVLY